MDASKKEMTLGEALSMYADQYTTQKKGARQELSRIRHWKAHPFSQRALHSFIPSDWRLYAIERQKTVSPTTVRLELALIRHLFTVASQDWALDLRTQFTSRTLPKVRNSRDRRLSTGEIEAIVRATGSAVLGNLLRFALETAMRRSEIASLRWRDVDLSKRTVTLSDTKNGDMRVVPLTKEAVRILDSLEKGGQGDRVWKMEADSVTQAFVRAVDRARGNYEKECFQSQRDPDPNFLVDIRFHDLRHEATSRLFERGMGTMMVAAITGHKTLQMLKRYTHLRPETIVHELDRTEGKGLAP
ncbi:MAG: site-specific integrase [Leptospirillia bacterium]